LDGTGAIRYTEFLAATIESLAPISEARLAEAFDRLDSDDSGYIDFRNLEEFFGQDVYPDYIQAIIEEADLTHDHRISYPEFLAQWGKESNPISDEIAIQPSCFGSSSTLTQSSSADYLTGGAVSASSPIDDVETSVGASDDLDMIGRANFMEEKRNSLRKTASFRGIITFANLDEYLQQQDDSPKVDMQIFHADV
jgi:hypothetical protein